MIRPDATAKCSIRRGSYGTRRGDSGLDSMTPHDLLATLERSAPLTGGAERSSINRKAPADSVPNPCLMGVDCPVRLGEDGCEPLAGQHSSCPDV